MTPTVKCPLRVSIVIFDSVLSLHLSFCLPATEWMNNTDKMEPCSKGHSRNGGVWGAWGSVGQAWGLMGSFEEKPWASGRKPQVGPTWVGHPLAGSSTAPLHSWAPAPAPCPVTSFYGNSLGSSIAVLTISDRLRRFYCHNTLNYNIRGGKEKFCLFCMYEYMLCSD